MAIADWYEERFLGGRWAPGVPDPDPLGINRAIRELLGAGGGGTCLEVGCGTGVQAAVARADAGRLPVRDASVPAVLAAMAHTDMPGYLAVLREVARVLRPGGVLAHVGTDRAGGPGTQAPGDRAVPLPVLERASRCRVLANDRAGGQVRQVVSAQG